MIQIATNATTDDKYEPTVIDVYGRKLSHPVAYPHTMEVFDSAGAVSISTICVN
ncbi:unnamed protein product [Anisakis simplex]|uniref:Uncharacterized protein n=1 Tax=Anisakis simplex TaxID=6269 RepID=A0A3P6NXP9_ANISI|nr:unnamed protein product [Anisakis simplex]